MLLFVGSAANDGIKKEILDDCQELLEIILKDNDLIFGACNHGLMGLSYQVAKKNNRHIIGVIPKVYQDSLEEISCDEEIITDEITESTFKILDKCDAIVILPGGFGSIYEIFVTLYKKICQDHNKKIVIYNSNGYYNDLITLMENIYKNNFAKDKIRDYYIITDNKEEIINYLKEV